MDFEDPSALSVGLLCQFTGGPFNGLTATIAKLCDQFCSVGIVYDNQPPVEVITETKWLKSLKEIADETARSHQPPPV